MTKAAPEASSPEPAVTTPERAGCPRLGCGLGLIAAILVGLLIAQPLVVEEAIIRFGPDGVRRKFLGRLERSGRLRRGFVFELLFDRDDDIASWAVESLASGRLAVTRDDLAALERSQLRSAIIELVRSPSTRQQDMGHGLALVIGRNEAGPEVCQAIEDEAFKTLSRPTGELRSRQVKALAGLCAERLPSMIRGLGPSRELAVRLETDLVLVLLERLPEFLTAVDPTLQDFGQGLLARTTMLAPTPVQPSPFAESADPERSFEPSHELVRDMQEDFIIVLRRRLLDYLNADDRRLRDLGYGLIMRVSELKPSWLPAFTAAERAALRMSFKRDQMDAKLGPRVRAARALPELAEDPKPSQGE